MKQQVVKAAAFGIGMLTLPQAALAQEKLPDSASEGDIIVTARRQEERLQDVPISITVYNQEDLSKRNIVNASDLAAYTPSLSANSRYGAENSTFAIRGFVQEQNTEPSVAVYFADVVAPRAIGVGTQAGNGSGPGSFFDLQNVQVLKGPQGTLFGRNTTGGAVLLVPVKPTNRLEGYVEGSVGDYALRRLQGVLNVPLSSKAFLRIGADYQTRDGYINNKSGIGPSRFADVNYYALRASLVVDLLPDLENYTIASYSDSRTNGSNPRIAFCDTTSARLTAVQGCAQIARQRARGDGYFDVESSHPNPRLKIAQWQVINTTTWRASDTLTVKNIVSYAELRQASQGNLFGDNFSLPNGTSFPYIGLFTDPGRNNAAQATFSEELQFQGRSSDGRFIWQAGGYFESSTPLGFQGTRTAILLTCADISNFQCSNTTGGGSIQQSLTSYRFRNLGAYAQATYQFTDQLSLTGGIRYTSDRTDATGQVRIIRFPAPNSPVPICGTDGRPAPTADVCSLNVITKSAKPTWLIDLDYKPDDQILLYAKYARGYRQGGVTASSLGFGPWGPEKVDSYEIGAKTSFDGAVRGTFNVALFYNDFTNQQLSAAAVPLPGFAPAQGILNGGKSRIQGVEVEASIQPFEGLRISGGYTFLDTKLISFSPPAFDATKFVSVTPTTTVGRALALSPRNKLTVTASYTLPLPESIGRVSAGATFTHTDSQIASTTSPIGILPATDLVNLNFGWEEIGGSDFDLSVFVTNLTNEKYPLWSLGIYSSAGYDGIVVGQPRMFGARLKYRFGQ